MMPWLRGRWHAAPQRVRRGLLAMAALVAMGVLAGLGLRGALGERLWPTQRAHELRVQAQAALDAGRLSSATDGSGARELFEAALALQPDQVEARAGLARVAAAALKQASAHADAGRLAHARIALRLASELQAPRDQLQAMTQRLAALESDDGRIALLLERARAALQAGHVDGADDAALPLYQRVVQLQPRNQAALEGREDALSDLLAPAPAALQAGDIARAADLIRRAERFDPGHAALPALRAGLGRAVEARARRVDALLRSDDLTAAAALCLASGDPGRGFEIDSCLAVLPGRLLQRAGTQAAEFDLAAARVSLEQARALGAEPSALAATEARLQRASRGASRLPRAAAAPGTDARVGRLLARAERAGQRGAWLVPPGDSAWDHLRQARALSPDDPRVLAALQAMVPAARRCSSEGLRDNNLGLSQSCLEAWQQLAPGDPGITRARQRLGERWLAMGAQRLADGDVAGARAALLRARGVQPGAAGLEDLAARIERASVGTP